MPKARRPKSAHRCNDGLNRQRNRREVAEFFGVSTSAVSNWSRDGCPRCGNGFKLADVARWLMSRKSLRHMSYDAAAGDEADPMLVGATSPSLERYRALRCEREELEIRKRRDELYDAQVVADFHSLTVRAISTAVQSLHRTFGDGAADIMSAVADQLEREFESYFAARNGSANDEV